MRTQPSGSVRRLASSPSASRMRELTPSAATIRSACVRSPLASVNSPSGVASTAFRAGDDLGARAPRGIGERVDHALAQHAVDAHVPRVRGEQAVVLVARLAHAVACAAADRVVARAERFQHAQAVLVDVDAGAGGAQPIGTLVQPHPPAPPREGARGGEPGEAAAYDLGPAFHCSENSGHDR